MFIRKDYTTQQPPTPNHRSRVIYKYIRQANKLRKNQELVSNFVYPRERGGEKRSINIFVSRQMP